MGDRRGMEIHRILYPNFSHLRACNKVKTLTGPEKLSDVIKTLIVIGVSRGCFSAKPPLPSANDRLRNTEPTRGLAREAGNGTVGGNKFFLVTGISSEDIGLDSEHNLSTCSRWTRGVDGELKISKPVILKDGGDLGEERKTLGVSRVNSDPVEIEGGEIGDDITNIFTTGESTSTRKIAVGIRGRGGSWWYDLHIHRTGDRNLHLMNKGGGSLV